MTNNNANTTLDRKNLPNVILRAFAFLFACWKSGIFEVFRGLGWFHRIPDKNAKVPDIKRKTLPDISTYF